MLNFLLGGIWSIVEAVLNFFIWLFIPSEGFLLSWQQEISGRFNERMGNIIQALGYIGSRFSNLQGYSNLDRYFEVDFPAGTFLHGMRVNLLTPARGFLGWLRMALTGVVVLLTALGVYSRVKSILRG